MVGVLGCLFRQASFGGLVFAWSALRLHLGDLAGYRGNPREITTPMTLASNGAGVGRKFDQKREGISSDVSS